MLSIPATKAFEIGSGFRGTEVPGSKHNDAFIIKEGGGLATVTNWSGGVQGGISNGEDIYFRLVSLEYRLSTIWDLTPQQHWVQVSCNDLPGSADCTVRRHRRCTGCSWSSRPMRCASCDPHRGGHGCHGHHGCGPRTERKAGDILSAATDHDFAADNGAPEESAVN
jgi:hypothetical protein